MNALEPHRVEKSARVARDERAIHVRLRDRVPSALGQRLGAITKHPAAVEQRRHERMLLEAVERHLRIEHRIRVVEAGHEPDGQLAVWQRVDEAAAEFIVPERVPHRMHDGAGFEAIAGHFPQFLEPDRELLRLPAAAKLKTPPQLLGQITAHAVAEDGDLGHDVDAWLKGRLPLTVPVGPAIACANTNDAPSVYEHLLPGEAGEEVDSVAISLIGQPANEPVQRDDVVTVITHRGRNHRKRELPLPCEEVDAVAAHLRSEGRTLLLKVRNQVT